MQCVRHLRLPAGPGLSRTLKLSLPWLLAVVITAAGAQSTEKPAPPPQSRNLAQGFSALPKGTRVVMMPMDMELFSVTAGGVLEPKADWTDTAMRHFKTALVARKKSMNLETVELSERDADEVEEINTLHGAVARAIAQHHLGDALRLPTKGGKLDWSMGDAVQVIKQKTGADYALFTWVRDSYASAERKATMVMLALLGVAVGGGFQIGYASLVNLNSGQIMWFNRLLRMSGDLREPEPAAETLDALLQDFPVSR